MEMEMRGEGTVIIIRTRPEGELRMCRRTFFRPFHLLSIV
jgi:hypothetical protein